MEVHIQRNNGKVDYEMFRPSNSFGRGIGKSALVSWLIIWFLSTRLGSLAIVTANTENQLRSKNLGEPVNQLTLAINGHWFKKTATTLEPDQTGLKKLTKS